VKVHQKTEMNLSFIPRIAFRFKTATGAVLVLVGIAIACAAAAEPTMPLEELGRRLFLDVRLSADGKTACASCHQPSRTFQDGRQVSVGAFARRGTRNAPSLLNVASQTVLFWDGRRSSLEEQALDPILNVAEHGLTSEAVLVKMLRGMPEYQNSLEKGSELKTVSAALSAFQKTLVDGRNGFENYLIDGDSTAISDSAKRGWVLFAGRAGCIECHRVESRAPISLTDQAFHSVFIPRQARGLSTTRLVEIFHKLSSEGASYDQMVAETPDLATLGRYVATRDPKDIGRFRTPSLRNVALTAPYMHDGSVSSLAEAVDLEVYYRGRVSGKPLILLDSEKTDIVEFLRSLTAARQMPASKRIGQQ